MRKILVTTLVAGSLIGGATASFAATTPTPAASMPAASTAPTKAAKPMETKAAKK